MGRHRIAQQQHGHMVVRIVGDKEEDEFIVEELNGDVIAHCDNHMAAIQLSAMLKGAKAFCASTSCVDVLAKVSNLVAGIFEERGGEVEAEAKAKVELEAEKAEAEKAAKEAEDGNVDSGRVHEDSDTDGTKEGSGGDGGSQTAPTEEGGERPADGAEDSKRTETEGLPHSPSV